ncbi:MAG: glutathione peroxidase [Clostridiales bacterium]|jgi:glutathione peroxidase|nr:glutathione peroxidase [Clostridiales bacterium]
MNTYDFSVKDLDGGEASLAAFKGQVALIVNTATHCGFTPQLKGLQTLYETYRDKGFVVLDFPCNQFARQAPESDAEINEICSLKFHTTFPRFAKIEVNGDKESPLYTHLKAAQGGKGNAGIKWNFTKFLVDRDGAVVARFSSLRKPAALAPEIEKLLNAADRA